MKKAPGILYQQVTRNVSHDNRTISEPNIVTKGIETKLVNFHAALCQLHAITTGTFVPTTS